VRSSTTRLALQRDGAKCRLCGFDVVMHVHHIIHKARGGNNDLDNLITLCPNHHAMVHRGLVTVEELRAALPASVALEAVAG
jgi:5-methylcytosine-specific restriction endonuclease McrA